MACISRIAKGKVPFANGTNYFYFEAACGLAVDDLRNRICNICQQKNPACKSMDSRQYDHGVVTGPIPVRSHIYGGAWYKVMAKAYGEPSANIIQMAEAARARAAAAATVAPAAPHKAVVRDEGMKRRGAGASRAGAVATNKTHVPVITQAPSATIYAEYVETEDILEVHEVIRVAEGVELPEALTKYIASRQSAS